jgi:hypothetical protein
MQINETIYRVIKNINRMKNDLKTKILIKVYNDKQLRRSVNEDEQYD